VTRLDERADRARADLAMAVRELGDRRRRAFDLVGHVRRHPVVFALCGTVLVGALVWRGARARARRREEHRLGARLARWLRGA
jgi:hypothetical protein